MALASFAGTTNWIPTVWSPLNALGLLLALMATNLVGGAAIVMPAIVFAVAFVVWCPNVWSGQTLVPRRSLVLAALGLALSVANILYGRQYGLESQGVLYVRLVTAASVVWWLLLIVAGVTALRLPSARRNLWFHVALFSWLGWYALPYMGELP